MIPDKHNKNKSKGRLTKQFLHTICTDFPAIKKVVDADVKSVDKHKYRIFKGFMQSRKTWAIISTSFYYLFRYKTSSFIVVQNSIDAVKQMTDRINSVFAEYCEFMEFNRVDFDFKTYFRSLKCKRGSKVSEDELRSATRGDTPGIYILIRNSIEINKAVSKIDGDRYITIIDESDFNDSGRNSKVQGSLNSLKERSRYVYDVTATPISSLMKENIDMDNVVVLSKPDGYKGITDIQFLDIKALPCIKTFDNPFVQDPNLETYLTEFSKLEPIKCNSAWGVQYLPRYTLIRLGLTIDPQILAAKWANRHFENSITCITYNGGGGITIRGNGMEDEPIEISGKRSKVVEGVHRFKNSIHIGSIIAFLQSRGVRKHPRIAVFACKLADRGISFCTSEYGKCIAKERLPWHLTEMYYVATRTCTQSNLLQAAGRLCGVYPDNIPLCMYSNFGEDIWKSFCVQEEVISRAKEEAAKEGATGDNYRSCSLIASIPISTDKQPVRMISRGYMYNKVQDDFTLGGWDWTVHGFDYDGFEPSFDGEDRPTKCKTQLTEKELEIMRADVEVRRTIEIEKKRQDMLKNIKVVKESSIKGKVSKRIYGFLVNALMNMGSGEWHVLAKVHSELVEEDTRVTKSNLKRRLKDYFKTKTTGSEDDDGVLIRYNKVCDVYEFRVNQ